VTAAIDRVAFYGQANDGLFVLGFGTGAINVAVTDSIYANNGYNGFQILSGNSRSIISLVLTRSVAASTNTGLQAAGPNANDSDRLVDGDGYHFELRRQPHRRQRAKPRNPGQRHQAVGGNTTNGRRRAAAAFGGNVLQNSSLRCESVIIESD
jgi:hypothetical protein